MEMVMKISTNLFFIGVVGFAGLQSAEPRSPKPLYYENVTPPPVPPRKSDNPPALVPRSPKKAEAFGSDKQSVIVEVGSDGKYTIPLETKSVPVASRKFLDSVYEYDVPFNINPPPILPLKNVVDRDSIKPSSSLVLAADEEIFSTLATVAGPQKNSLATPKRSLSSTSMYMNTSPDSKGGLPANEDLYLTPVINSRVTELQKIVEESTSRLEKLYDNFTKLEQEMANKQPSKDDTIEKRTKNAGIFLQKLQGIQEQIEQIKKQKKLAEIELDEIDEK